MKPREVLGLDLGEARTGIARGNSAAGLAEPLTVVPTKDLFKNLHKLVEANDVRELVVGLPRNLEGKDTAQTAWVRAWVASAKTKLVTPMFWQDEALTTKQAENTKDQRGTDAVAAALILQDYLDTPKDRRVQA